MTMLPLMDFLSGCNMGSYGDNCDDTCGQCLIGSTCDTTTGHCLSGCTTWWVGDKCKTKLGRYHGTKLFTIVY